MTTPHQPLTPDAVDVLLSAELDNDFDGAARELGLSVPEARAQLATTTGIDERRRALSHARELVATRPPFEATDQDRLVARAMARDDLADVRDRHADRDRRRRAFAGVGWAAAAVAVLVGVIFGVASLHSGGSSKSASSPPAAARASAGAEKTANAPGSPTRHGTLDFGDVTSRAALRAPARRALSDLTNAAAGNSQAVTSSTSNPPNVPFAADGSGNGAPQPQKLSDAAPDCTARARSRYKIAAEPVVVGTGRVSGVPVEILIFDAAKPVAYVVRAADCALVRTQPLG